MYVLPPPNLYPLTEGGILHRNAIPVNDGIELVIPPYVNASYADKIEIYWNYELAAYFIIKEPQFKGWVANIDNSKIKDGMNNVYYIITDVFGNSSNSPSISISVVN
ncbi:TPA: hypothetical protein ACPZHQ_004149 [Yersinia enterocolitica]